VAPSLAGTCANSSVLRSVNNFFGPAPYGEQLNAVFQHFVLRQGMASARLMPANQRAAVGVPAEDCHADDAIHALRTGVKPLRRASAERHDVGVADKTKRGNASSDAQSAILWQPGNLSGRGACGGSLEIEDMNKKDMPSLSSFWQKTLEPDIQRAVKLLFAESKNLPH